jgi:phosphonopyruvate decarboxylase
VPQIEPLPDEVQARPSRQDVLRAVLAASPIADTVVLASTGFCGRELCALEDRPNQLYMVGSMGCVSSLALGLALSRPRLRVIALDGDGAALMRMGNFATIGAYAPANLWHLLLDNGAHDSTGGQTTVSPQISFATVAAGCGYSSALQTAEPGRLTSWLRAPLGAGPHFACVMTRTGSPKDLPRPALGPVAVRERLARHIAGGAARTA